MTIRSAFINDKKTDILILKVKIKDLYKNSVLIIDYREVVEEMQRAGVVEGDLSKWN